MTILLATCSLTLTGCPDRSHQRPVPDYNNMVDNAESEEEVMAREAAGK